MMSLELRSLPSLVQVTWGNGSPFTLTFSSKREPSTMSRFGFKPLRNEGGHIKESSGGKANSLVVLRDRLPPVESDLRYAFCFGFLPKRASAASLADPAAAGGS